MYRMHKSTQINIQRGPAASIERREPGLPTARPTSDHRPSQPAFSSVFQPAPTSVRPRPVWLRRYRAWLVVVDLLAAVFASALAYQLRFGVNVPGTHSALYVTISVILPLLWAASLPFTAELTVRKLSWPVFLTRLAETIVGLILVTAVLLSGGSSSLVPWLLAGPALVNTWYLRRMAVRSRPTMMKPIAGLAVAAADTVPLPLVKTREPRDAAVNQSPPVITTG
jgi:hypothetical protein